MSEFRLELWIRGEFGIVREGLFEIVVCGDMLVLKGCYITFFDRVLSFAGNQC